MTKRTRYIAITVVSTILFFLLGSVAIWLFLSQRHLLPYVLGGYLLLTLFFFSMKLMLVRMLLRPPAAPTAGAAETPGPGDDGTPS